jgi:hypothetical protein
VSYKDWGQKITLAYKSIPERSKSLEAIRTKYIDLRDFHQDYPLTGTAVMSEGNGNQIRAIKYYPYESTRSSSAPMDKKFTRQGGLRNHTQHDSRE